MDNLKFLLVEDIREDTELIQQQLEKEFTFTIHIVRNKQEYSEALHNFAPDVILSGIYGKTPKDSWALVLRDQQLPNTPFIVITSTFEDEIAMECLDRGVTNYLSKEHLVSLNFIIRMALNHSRPSEQKKSAKKDFTVSLEDFRKLVVHDISGEYLGDENKILFCNDKVLEMFEFSDLEELNAYGSYNLYEYPEDRSKLINDLKEGKSIENRESIMHTKTGRPIVVLENAFADLDKEGKIVTMFGYLNDVTQERHFEEQLRASENLFRNLTESTSAGIAIYDKEYFLYTNPAFSKLVGYSRAELLKMNFWEVAAPDQRQMIKERGQKRVGQENVISEYQFKVFTKEGQYKWVSFSAAAITYKDRPAAICTLYDITLQKNAAQEIKKLSTVIEQSPLSIIITNMDAKIEYANRAFTVTTGYSLTEAIGHNPNILKSGQTPKETYIDLWKSITSGLVWKGDLINKKKDGTIFTEIAVIFPIFGEDGAIIRYAAIKRDVTKEKEIEAELREEKKKAEDANRLKSGILTNMSHELRTPLNGILGFSTLIADSVDLEEIREMTMYIQDSGQRLLRTLNLIIEISAIDSGNFEADYQKVDLNEMIRKIVRDFKVEADVKKLKIIFSDSLTTFPVVTDLKYTHGAIENMVDNAIKFTNKGSVRISVEKEKDYAVIHIADTGIGISEKKQKLIFEDFQQESMGHNRIYEGTGLGLSLAKKYVEKLNGFIRLKSKVGEGSTFSIYIPEKPIKK